MILLLTILLNSVLKSHIFFRFNVLPGSKFRMIIWPIWCYRVNLIPTNALLIVKWKCFRKNRIIRMKFYLINGPWRNFIFLTLFLFTDIVVKCNIQPLFAENQPNFSSKSTWIQHENWYFSFIQFLFYSFHLIETYLDYPYQLKWDHIHFTCRLQICCLLRICSKWTMWAAKSMKHRWKFANSMVGALAIVMLKK